MMPSLQNEPMIFKSPSEVEVEEAGDKQLVLTSFLLRIGTTIPSSA